MIARIAMRQIRARPWAALVTVFGVATGVAGVRAMSLGSDGALATMRATYAEAAGPADWTVLPRGDSRAPLPDGTEASIATAPGVTNTLPLVLGLGVRLEEARLWMGVVLPEGDGGLLFAGVDADDPPRWDRVTGDDPTCGIPSCAEGARVLVGDTWARQRGLAAGDPLNVLVGGRRHELVIGGTVSRRGLGGRGYGRVVIAPGAAVRTLFGLPMATAHELGVVGGSEALAAVVPAGARLLRPADRGEDVEQKLANMRAGTDLLSGVTLLLAGLLIFGQFSARAAERTRVFGLLRAVGATRRQASATLLLEAALLGVVGSALGALVGAPLAAGVAFGLSQAAQADLHVGVADVRGALFAFALGIGTALVSAALPALRASAGSPLDAVRARGHAANPLPPVVAGLAIAVLCTIGLSFVWDPAGVSRREWTLLRVVVGLAAAAAVLPAALMHVPRFVPRLGPIAGLGAAALRWRPVRSGLAAGAVLISVAMVGGVGALAGGLEAEVDSWARRALGWDLYVSRADGFAAEDLAQIQALPGVELATAVSIRPVPIAMPSVDMTDHTLSLVAIDPVVYARADRLSVVDSSGGPTAGAPEIVASLADDRSVLVTTVVAAQFQLRSGDTLVIRGSPDRTVEVRGVVVDYTQNGFGVIGSRALLEATQGPSRADLVVVDGTARTAIEALPGVVVESSAELRGRVSDLVRASIAALDVLLWLAGIIGVLGVGATLAQSAIERRGDVALLRAVGLARKDVPAMFVVESLLTAGVGVVGGVPFGIALGKVFTDATGTLGIALPYVPPWPALLGASVAALLTAAIAGWIPGRRASAVSPVEALRQ